MSQSNALSNRQIANATLIVLLGFFASGVLGIVRTSIISSTFGTSDALDAFLAAQRIPEIVFVLVAGGALGSSFIPVFSRLRANPDGFDDAWRLASAVMTLSMLAAAVLGAIVILFAPWIVKVFLLPGKAPEVQNLAAALVRLMMVSPAIFAVSGLVMGILQAHQRFLLPAIAISMNNIGLIAGAVLIAYWLPPLDGVGQVANANVYGLAYGSILSAVLHLLIQLPGLVKLGARLRFLPDRHVPGVMEVLRLMGPRVLGLAVVQINFVVSAALSSPMAEGSYTALNTAWTLMFFSLGIIAQSVASAVFPSLSALFAEKDMDGFKDRLAGALRGVLFLSFPATVGLIVLGKPIITLIYQRNEWTAESTAATAWALSFFALGIAGHSLLEVLSRAFYALEDTRTPVIVGTISMASNIILSLILIRVIGDPGSLAHGPFAGLALANSLTTIFEGLALWIWLRHRIGAQGKIGGINDRVVLSTAWRVLVASLGMGLIVWLIVTGLADQSVLLVMMLGLIVGASTFFGLSMVLGVSEARTLPRIVLSRLSR
jgi:putative peptidoglycan lipid II flippase